MLPLMIAGMVFAVARAGRSRAARLLLVLVLVYPSGDILSAYVGVHALRSAPGIPALTLLGGYGLAAGIAWLWSRSRLLARAAAAAIVLAAGAVHARYLVRYFGEYNERPEIYHGYHTDLLEAAQWLRPRLRDTDATFWTTIDMNEPWAVTLIGLDHRPADWFAEPRDRQVLRGWDVYVRYGRQYFMYEDLWRPWAERLRANGRADRTIFVVRPGELGLRDPIHVIRRPDGREVLWICQASL